MDGSIVMVRDKSAWVAANRRFDAARAKAKPGEITYGSGGVGSAADMNAEQLRAMAGIKELVKTAKIPTN